MSISSESRTFLTFFIGIFSHTTALDLHWLIFMTRHRFYGIPYSSLREKLWIAVNEADDMRARESRLIRALYDIDEKRMYVLFGYKSLMGFCHKGLKFSKTQSQRLVTLVRRYQFGNETEKIPDESEEAIVIENSSAAYEERFPDLMAQMTNPNVSGATEIPEFKIRILDAEE